MNAPRFPSVFVLGAGRVGRSLAVELGGAGVPLAGIWSRTEEHAREAAALTRCEARFGAWPDTSAAEVVLFCLPAAATVTAAEGLAAAGPAAPRQIWLHAAPTLPGDVLRRGPGLPLAVGSVFPFIGFGVRPRVPAPNYAWLVEGEPAAVNLATRIGRAMGHEVLAIPAPFKPVLHTSLTFVTGFMAALLDAAADLFVRTGMPYSEATDILEPVLQATCEAFLDHGAASISGPVARGEADCVARHLETLHQVAPDMMPLYRWMARYQVALTMASGQSRPEHQVLVRLLLDRDESPADAAGDPDDADEPRADGGAADLAE